MIYLLAGLLGLAFIALGALIARLREQQRRKWIYRFQHDNSVKSVPEFRAAAGASRASYMLGFGILILFFSGWAYEFAAGGSNLFYRLVTGGALLGLQVAALPLAVAILARKRADAVAAFFERLGRYVLIVWGVSAGLLVCIMIFEFLASSPGGGPDGPHVVFRPPLVLAAGPSPR